MTALLWNATIPNREPVGSNRMMSGTTASLQGALWFIHEELPTETPEETWKCEAYGRSVAFEELDRLAAVPSATGPFTVTAPNGAAIVQSYLVGQYPPTINDAPGASDAAVNVPTIS